MKNPLCSQELRCQCGYIGYMYLFRVWVVSVRFTPNNTLPSVCEWGWVRSWLRAWRTLGHWFSSVQSIHSVMSNCDPMNRNMPGLPVHHKLPELTQTHVHWVGDAIQPSHPLSSPSPPAPNPSQHHSLFQWVRSLHQVAKVLEFQFQHQSFQWTPRTDLL